MEIWQSWVLDEVLNCDSEIRPVRGRLKFCRLYPHCHSLVLDVDLFTGSQGLSPCQPLRMTLPQKLHNLCVLQILPCEKNLDPGTKVV
jgi:hypothetical protein